MKMLKLPRFPKMNVRPRKKLRATAARRPLRIAATADYDDMAEPNMKLSRALLIVLLLHVVAVSGIIAFNAIKTHQTVIAPKANVSSTRTTPVSATPLESDPSSHPVVAQKENARHEEKRDSRAGKSTAKDERKGEHAKGGESAKHDDSGKVYVVAKGDNPVTIAKKLKVSYDELLALNHIDDPRKLQIGQKLLVPAKTTKSKKDE